MKKTFIFILAMVLVLAFAATAAATSGEGDVTWEINTGTGYGSIPISGVDVADEAGFSIKAIVTADESAEAVVITGISATAGNPSSEGIVDGTGVATATEDYTFSTTNYVEVTFTVNYTINAVADSDTQVVKVYVGDDDATLDSLALTAGTDSGLGESTFSSSDFGSAGNYSTVNLTGHVDDAATNVLVAAVANGTGATVTVGGDANSKTLTFSGNSDATANVVVTAQNGRTKTYALTVKQDWDDTSLTLTIGTKTLTDDAGDFDYFFPYGSIDSGESITFTPNYAAGASYEAAPRSADADAITVTDRETSLKVTFEEDPDSTYRVNITVTAPDGDTEEDYVLYLEESEPVLLDDLEIMIGSTTSSKDLDFTMVPATFDDETFTYYVFVPWDDSSAYEDGVNVYFGVEYDTDTIDSVKCYATSTTTLDDGDDPVKVGSVADGEDEEFTITLIDEDDNTQDYKVYVFYGEVDADDDADLDDLYVKYGTSYKTEANLSPSFSSNTLTYTASLPLNTKSAKITLKLSDSGAIIICNGEKVSSTITVTDLKSGANTYKIVVIAEDYDTTKTYNLTINVGSGGLLTNLVFTPISGTLNVSPSFSGDVYNYVANVANGVSAIYVTPTAIDSSYTISVYKGSSDYKTVLSGKTSSAITLNEGLNEVKVYVYKSGSSKTYTLSIYRQPATTKYVVSSQAITVNGVNKTLYAVNINGNNYLKLRDLAYMLSGTTKQFNVTFSTSTNTAAITSLTAYVNDPTNPVNQPIVLSNPQLSSQLVTLNGKAAYPIAYNVAGSNYVNLRQICAMLDIGLTYSSATNTISITTANSYSPGL
jgi:hypothetical protein